MTTLYSKLLVLVVAAMPLYLIRFSLINIPTNLFELSVLGLVATGLLLPSVRREWRQAEANLPRAVIVLVGLFVLAALVSATISPVPRVSFGIFKSWIIIPLLLGWLVYVTPEIRNSKFEIRNWLITSGVIVSLLSLTQFHWGERLSGIYDVPNSLALYLAPLIILAMGSWFSPPYEGGVPRPRRGVGVISAAIMFLTLLLTQSIAAISSVLIVATILVFYHLRTFPHFEIWKGGRYLSALTLCFILLVGSAWYLTTTGRFAYLTTPLISSTPNSLSVRLQLWDISWELIKEQPLLGVGLGQFEPAYQQKLHEKFAAHVSCQLSAASCSPRPLAEWVFRDPHNWPLSFWLNTGLLGLLSFVGIHFLAIKQLPAGRSLGEGWNNVTIALVTLLLFGLVDTIYWKNDLSALHWVLLALLLKYQTSAPAHP